MSSATAKPKLAEGLSPISPSRHLFSVETFNAMTEAGIFTEDDRLELLDGEIIEMTPVGTRHSSCVRLLTYLLSQATKNALDVQNPLILNGSSEVYPDLAVLKEAPQTYTKRKPNSEDVLLLVEVSDSTLHFDRTTKLPRYAAAGVPEVWIVDLQNERILTHKRPLDGVYGEVNEYKCGDKLSLEVLEASFEVAEILP